MIMSSKSPTILRPYQMQKYKRKVKYALRNKIKLKSASKMWSMEIIDHNWQRCKLA